MWRGVIAEYRPYLPVTEGTPVVTLLEGGTPLLRAGFAGAEADAVRLKVEAGNPTGSFKDRGMTVAVSKALEAGAQGVICASTGNTAASAAAYAARAGLPCTLLIPAEGVALGKLVQAAAHGATIVPVAGTFDQALDLARQAAERFNLTLVNSVNPYRLEGQKTAAFEICDVLGRAPEALVIPVGNAGNITAYWKGFTEYHAARRIATRPRLIGVQAEGAAPLVLGRPVEHPRTVASAIRIGRPASWDGAVRAVEESGGEFLTVTDEEILAAQDLLGREGVFVEPASAAAAAGWLKLRRLGRAPADAVCVLTGHGLKDPAVIQQRLTLPPPVPATPEAIGNLLHR
ncbi:MAG: threonine synthase [Armatimonadota bacterium]|nr:threonine synthase [Armatimonadota bacterium]MDR7450883.1 threonine synthase [Armatimonadota bacterium]MDR7465805.1 threonine synthase [Armatimonadota bacterium]MDR7493713.1 threonine synthase [Armatimonadota bacterium]MDR7498319.1 threonine synthase [Armatimonadota bacterium]